MINFLCKDSGSFVSYQWIIVQMPLNLFTPAQKLHIKAVNNKIYMSTYNILFNRRGKSFTFAIPYY